MSTVGQEIISKMDELIKHMQETKKEIAEKMKEAGIETDNE